jgi:hypothetical protein
VPEDDKEVTPMTVSEYLRSMADSELVEQFDWFHQKDESGLMTLACVSVTPYGAITKTMVEHEISRRVT